MPERYDLVVIGAGSAGLTAARFAAQLGRRVLLIEKHRIGGDCTWTGCVPSKALLRAARAAHEVRHAARFGIETTAPRIDMARVRDYVQGAIQAVHAAETAEQLAAEGIDVRLGAARFLDPDTVRVGTDAYGAGAFLVATGAAPSAPPVSGLSELPFDTHETIFENDQLPEHLLVLGAGPIGCELAQAYRRLGARVTVAAAEFMPQDEPAARRVLAGVLRGEGIELVIGPVSGAAFADGRYTLDAADGPVHGDRLLVAAGRAPRVEGLGLAAAGVAYAAAGIEVDGQLRTSRRNIFAAGDCVGGPQFTHYAGWQGFQAARNALLPLSSRGLRDRVPWVTFTDPEVAHVGLGEAAARAAHGDDVRVARWALAQVDRAVAEGETAGFIQVVHLANGRLLGATVVAARAGELIAEFALALDQSLDVEDLARSLQPYPTYASGMMRLAAEAATEAFLAGWLGRLFTRWGGNGAGAAAADERAEEPVESNRQS